ncbi:hypothetical protein [uncultured Fibrobacter sp.]|uniref:hypothetical protein n=1 Tax=uncultured Fibrobacter sp. TaxID=261512 RepID=UPI002622B67C|nr:hypothetical protein [uncultured Fibrobacter sp.]
MHSFSRLAWRTVAAFAVALLVGCEKDDIPVDYATISYKSIQPALFSDKSVHREDAPALTRELQYRYAVMLGDTLDVSVLEFRSDVYALDYYMNSGHFQGSTSILRGNFLEQSFRADNRIFIFRHDSYRRYERGDLENFVRKFPGYHGGFPQEFLSLPFEYREQGRASIQTRYFLGIQSTFPVLVQSYRDGNLRWNIARSWEQVDAEAFDAWAAKLRKIEPQEIFPANDCVYFDAGEGAYGIASRLAGGRVVVAWGYMAWFDLEHRFFTASDRIYEARF